MGKNKINLGIAAATFLVGAAVGAGISHVQDSEPEPSVHGGIVDSYRTEEDCLQHRKRSAPSYPE
ncbi:hypothetical protein [Corynebacterium renale]|uniref:hypothetical protein n=1 Tax=Corynebacterium renale TaxID=1724 RepID=UPI00128B4ED2|nr:hypothetical protein [Corynebacterium renale]